jgi:hypothetical protein
LTGRDNGMDAVLAHVAQGHRRAALFARNHPSAFPSHLVSGFVFP